MILFLILNLKKKIKLYRSIKNNLIKAIICYGIGIRLPICIVYARQLIIKMHTYPIYKICV